MVSQCGVVEGGRDEEEGYDDCPSEEWDLALLEEELARGECEVPW